MASGQNPHFRDHTVFAIDRGPTFAQVTNWTLSQVYVSQVIHPNSKDTLNSVKFENPENPRGSCGDPILRDTYARANWQASVNRTVVQGDAVCPC